MKTLILQEIDMAQRYKESQCTQMETDTEDMIQTESDNTDG